MYAFIGGHMAALCGITVVKVEQVNKRNDFSEEICATETGPMNLSL